MGFFKHLFQKSNASETDEQRYAKKTEAINQLAKDPENARIIGTIFQKMIMQGHFDNFVKARINAIRVAEKSKKKFTRRSRSGKPKASKTPATA